ncbi:MAG: hypothetical protein ACD_51C00283G0046 [uncultured bacterium]|nr:MAG: hypothetical protein ACD_51C00283G0046 [uncultured bacterium]OGJ48461.1 MAG: hypothetical protein A2244_05565 [Candidatus Peregrinibacteria bacterium RIFOXYA2_FULL_41_18]OGJ49661.1 MAG: hypothetical protein A2344_02540 [Candidatus Peregrinibacteria bacterium RIFOXYB12_FULL_41_12]OGJ52489.1 MAG: hypothetical protein A2448_00340 [Candidatus Peregrinibacteria bacterium RIFOXYC2_FULL_41_22]
MGKPDMSLPCPGLVSIEQTLVEKTAGKLQKGDLTFLTVEETQHLMDIGQDGRTVVIDEMRRKLSELPKFRLGKEGEPLRAALEKIMEPAGHSLHRIGRFLKVLESMNEAGKKSQKSEAETQSVSIEQLVAASSSLPKPENTGNQNAVIRFGIACFLVASRAQTQREIIESDILNPQSDITNTTTQEQRIVLSQLLGCTPRAIEAAIGLPIPQALPASQLKKDACDKITEKLI